MQLLSEQCPRQTKEVWGFYLGRLCMFIWKALRGRHIPEHALFKFLVQEGPGHA
jgi:hypothetical protein